MGAEVSRFAQQVGANFESWLDGQHEMARHLGLLAHVEHTAAKARYLTGKLMHVAPGVADYVGCLGSGGYLSAEAKSTSHKRLLRSVIEPLQARHLDLVAKAGGLALLLAEFRSDGLKRFAIPWAEVPWKIARSADGITPDDVLSWQVQVGECYLSKFVTSSGKSFSTRVIHR